MIFAEYLVRKWGSFKIISLGSFFTSCKTHVQRSMSKTVALFLLVATATGCSDAGARCRAQDDCCSGLSCESSAESKKKTCVQTAPDLCASVDCSSGGVYASCDASTGQCVCDNANLGDVYPNCLGDGPCDDPECSVSPYCDDTIYYPCPSGSVKGDCSKMVCNPDYRGGTGEARCVCEPTHEFFYINYLPGSCDTGR